MQVCQDPGRELTTSLSAGWRRWTIFFTFETSGCFLTFLYFLPENSTLWHDPRVHASLAFLLCVLCLKCNDYFRSCAAPYKSLCRHIRNANASPLLGHTQDQSVSPTAMPALDLTHTPRVLYRNDWHDGWRAWTVPHLLFYTLHHSAWAPWGRIHVGSIAGLKASRGKARHVPLPLSPVTCPECGWLV